MKKIAIITLLALFVNSGSFAATVNSVNKQQNRNEQTYSNRNVFNKTTLKTNNNNNYLETNDVEYEDIQTEKSQNAFANNYQNLTSNNKYELSQVEKLFNGNEVEVTSNPLRQVGYDFFTAPITQNMNSTGKFDDNYKLTIGEKVSAYLYGDSVDVVAISGSNLLSPVVQTEVDSKGNIFISGIGVVPA